jgi:hypothetical protein
MEYLLLILTVLGVIIGILYLYSSQYDYDVYKYKCHHCKKKFKESEINDYQVLGILRIGLVLIVNIKM